MHAPKISGQLYQHIHNAIYTYFCHSRHIWLPYLSFRSSCQDFRCSNHTLLNATVAYTNNCKPCILLGDSSKIFNTKIDLVVVWDSPELINSISATFFHGEDSENFHLNVNLKKCLWKQCWLCNNCQNCIFQQVFDTCTNFHAWIIGQTTVNLVLCTYFWHNLQYKN